MGKQLLTGNVSDYSILWRNGHSMICTSVVPVAFRPFMPCPSFLPSTRLHFCIHVWALLKESNPASSPILPPSFLYHISLLLALLALLQLQNKMIQLPRKAENSGKQVNRGREEHAAGNGGGREGELERIAKITFLWQTAFNLVQWPCEITAFPWAAALMLVFLERHCSMRKSGRFWQNSFQRLLVELVSQLGLHADISHV